VTDSEPRDIGPWRGPSTDEWVQRIARPILREGESLPLIKPYPECDDCYRADGTHDPEVEH
jgi:hypothetical protein